MKYNININQKAAMELDLDLDLIDWAVFDYMRCFAMSVKITRVTIEGEIYFWIQYAHFIKEMPLLGIKSKQVLKRRIDKLVTAGLLEKKLVNNNSTYFKFTELSDLVITDSKEKKGVKPKSTPLKPNSTTPYTQNTKGGSTQGLSHNNNTNNNNTKSSIINNTKQSFDTPNAQSNKDTQVATKKELLTRNINLLIEELKEVCLDLGIAYDKTRERQFGNHIIRAREYGAFCENIGQTRIEFAKNILIASEKINYWKGVCAGPKTIYQNYADVYNATKSKHNKTKSKKIGVTTI